MLAGCGPFIHILLGALHGVCVGVAFALACLRSMRRVPRVAGDLCDRGVE